MRRHLLVTCLLLTAIYAEAQTNVRAWYAEGQVWIVWHVSLPLPLTVGVYESPAPFTDISAATLIGRPFNLDYLPTALKEQVDTSSTYRIPDGNGGVYQLDRNEGLFVFTPHQAGALYFAVVPWGQTQITAGDNITDAAIAFDYDPLHDPVECHLQSAFPDPFAAGYTCFAFYMWVDGRDDYWNARPDFPVMGNAAKNGMAGFFFISVPNDLDTTHPFPLSVWLHGGGGNARQSLAGSRAEINISPQKGILLSHNDDVFGSRGQGFPFPENPSFHFGYRKNWDPFVVNNFPAEEDTIINYTQRRYLWIDAWLMRHYNIDPASIHIHGHSMGSWGATALAKAYPEHYATATIFNNGFRGPDPGTGVSLFGEGAQNFPTNLKNRNGETVHFLDIFDLTTSISNQRDWPLFHSYHSKNDTGDSNYWGESVVNNYIAADAGGQGMALYWSEREHGVDTGPAHNDHWVSGIPADQQTITDNVDWNETLTRSDMSFPAFFNHREDPNANDPGDGTPGTGVNGVGDDWGTWGGWHRWDNASIVDQAGQWSVVAWLESNAIFDHDHCPFPSLMADLAIRRPVNFKPATGNTINWKTEDVATGNILQSGTVDVNEDDLVLIRQIVLYPENVRKVKITITDPAVATHEPPSVESQLVYLSPNPAKAYTTIHFTLHAAADVQIGIYDLEGRLLLSPGKKYYYSGDQQQTIGIDHLQAGIYFVRVQCEDLIISKVLVVE